MPHRQKSHCYAVYTRQSSDGLLDFSSCEAQFVTCQEFAREAGETNLRWYGQRFDDEGCSGATLERPRMRKLRKVIDLGGIHYVYAVALDRLSRNMRDAVVLLDGFDKPGVELRLVHQPELTSGPQHRFLRHVLAAFAEFEHDMIATRIAESRAHLKKLQREIEPLLTRPVGRPSNKPVVFYLPQQLFVLAQIDSREAAERCAAQAAE